MRAHQENHTHDSPEFHEAVAKHFVALKPPEPSAVVAEVAANTPPKQIPHPKDTADWRDCNRRHKQDFTGFYLDDGRG
jgi:hypothetical protein